MFIGSLAAYRFLSLIAHSVVTVIIFLSKVVGETNERVSRAMFICSGKLISTFSSIPGFLKAGLAKMTTDSTTWQLKTKQKMSKGRSKAFI